MTHLLFAVRSYGQWIRREYFALLQQSW